MSTQERKTPEASLGFPQHARITRGAELQRIAQEGKRLRTTHLEVRTVTSPLAHPPTKCTRIGLIVPRFGQTAVARNRLKRRLRELSRTRFLPSGIAVDVVIRIRPEAYQATYAQLTKQIEQTVTLVRKWVIASQDEATSRTAEEQSNPPSNS